MKELLKNIIESKYGWAIAEQFEDVFINGDDLENQNSNALLYIKDCISELDWDIFSDQSQMEINDIYEQLDEFLHNTHL